MKKFLCLSLVLILALSLNVSLAQSCPEDMKGQILADYSVTTIDGSTFTLSESLKSHDLVLINFWATWCGPCCMEFPYLEEAWEKYGDSVDVIALSVEETDSFETLRAFASEYGLNFSIGRDDLNLFGNMYGYAIPTTLIVDKDRRVVSVEIGAQCSVEGFTNLFDSLLQE